MEQLTPHPHAALIGEWSDHLRSGAVAAKWYVCEVKVIGDRQDWHAPYAPTWELDAQYRIVMTPNHPHNKPPTKKIVIELELSEDEVAYLTHQYENKYRGLSAEFVKLNAAILQALKESEC